MIFRGTTLAASVSVLLAALSLLKQISLGWYLTQNDLGLFGIAVSLNLLIASLQDGSIAKILIQKGTHFERLSAAGFFVSTSFSALAATTLILAALIYGGTIGEPVLVQIVCVQALAILIASPTSVFKAGVLNDLHFNRVSLVNLIANAAGHIAVIALAISGAGVFSLVLPIILVRVIELTAYSYSCRKVRYTGFWKHIYWTDVKMLVSSMKWLMASSLAVAVIINGDYFILGMLIDRATLGTYFFGFQLTATFSALLTGSLGQIVMPALSKIRNDHARKAEAYYNCVRMISLFSFPLCCLAAILVAPLMHLLWSGKWDNAIIVSQLLLLVLPLRLLAPIGRSFLEADGRWRSVTAFLSLDALGVLTSAAIGGFLGSLLGIAISVSAWRLMVGLIQVLIMPTIIGVPVTKLAKTTLRLLCINAGCLILSALACDVRLGFHESSPSTYLAMAGMFTGLYCALSALFCSTDHSFLFKRLHSYIR